MLGNNLFRIPGLYAAIPDGFRINHHRRTMLALIQASGLVDAHLASQAGGFRKLL